LFSSSDFFFVLGAVVVFGEVVVVAVAVVSVSESEAVAVVSVAGSGCSSWGRGCGVTRGRSGRGVAVVLVGEFVIGDTGGGAPREVPAVSVPRGFGFVGIVKFVVVSAFVSVTGGGVSPGLLMVDVTPLADPS
jgi:hypothetical protein